MLHDNLWLVDAVDFEIKKQAYVDLLYVLEELVHIDIQIYVLLLSEYVGSQGYFERDRARAQASIPLEEYCLTLRLFVHIRLVFGVALSVAVRVGKCRFMVRVLIDVRIAR